MILTLEKQLDALAEYAVGDFHRTRLGLPTLDATIGGPAPGETCTITGRSFTGKSIIGQNIVLNNPKVPSIFFSLEMPAAQALIRLYSMWAHVPSRAVQSAIDNGLIPDNLYDLADAFPYHRIVDTPSLSIDGMTKAVEAFRDDVGHNPEFVVLDYLELMGRDVSQGSLESVQNQFVSVRAWARENNTRLFLVHQSNMAANVWEPPTQNSPRYAGMAQSDFLLGVWRPHKDPTASDSDRRFYADKFMINVIKNRPYFEEHDGILCTVTQSLRLIEGDILSMCNELKASGEPKSERILADLF